FIYILPKCGVSCLPFPADYASPYHEKTSFNHQETQYRNTKGEITKLYSSCFVMSHPAKMAPRSATPSTGASQPPPPPYIKPTPVCTCTGSNCPRSGSSTTCPGIIRLPSPAISYTSFPFSPPGSPPPPPGSVPPETPQPRQRSLLGGLFGRPGSKGKTKKVDKK
ncbi:hypothetical protein F5Y10DRAFT_292520, partial [Nemania abortiva]